MFYTLTCLVFDIFCREYVLSLDMFCDNIFCRRYVYRLCFDMFRWDMFCDDMFSMCSKILIYEYTDENNEHEYC